jgi:hypothetical protein
MAAILRRVPHAAVAMFTVLLLLLRRARHAAALLPGPRVLPPPAIVAAHACTLDHKF